MDSIVKTRPSHYETLGLSPGASKDEIARAYARGMGAFGSRSLTDVAAASIAFETLRDPDRRRAYDQSIGLGQAAQPRIASIGGRAQYIGPAPAAFAGEALHATLSPRAFTPKEAAAEPRTASFIAASLRSPAERAPDPEPVRPEPQARVKEPRAQVRPPIDRPVSRPISQAANLRLADADEAPFHWSRTAMIGGGLVAGVVLLGAFAGWQAGHGETQPAEAAVTAPLPAPKPVAATNPPAAVPVRSVPEAQARRLVRPPVAAVRTARPTAPQPSARVDQLAAAIQSAPAAPDAVTAEQPSSESAPVETAAAMPLPNATIARTIDRIGYSCGKVASTSAIAGAHGAFTVTCTSGQSYRAAPVGGRYRFHRLGSQ